MCKKSRRLLVELSIVARNKIKVIKIMRLHYIFWLLGGGWLEIEISDCGMLTLSVRKFDIFRTGRCFGQNWMFVVFKAARVIDTVIAVFSTAKVTVYGG